MNRRLKKSVVYSLFVMAFIAIMGSLIAINYMDKKYNKTAVTVSKGILDYHGYIPVLKTNDTIVRPYYDNGVDLVLRFYDYNSTEEEQKKALIYYEGSYIQSSGVAYSKKEPFDVISILDGTVKEVTHDDILGNIIVIEHENGYVSVYQSVDDIVVEEGSPIVQGQGIAKSSNSNILKDLGNHLYFELSKDGEYVNPEEYYNKSINEKDV